jgi:hypothetical protein
MTLPISKLFFDVDTESDWCALLHGSWAIPEGTRADWLRIVNAIESGGTHADGDSRRLAFRRHPSGEVQLYSPRNEMSPTGGTWIAANEVSAFCAMVRRELSAVERSPT